MQQIASGVYAVGGYVNAYVVDGDQGVILIDTGLPKKEGLIENVLTTIGRNPSDITAIVLTHAHVDHVGGAAVMKASSGADVIAPASDTSAIQGEAPTPTPPMMRGPLKLMAKLLPKAEPVVVDHPVSESMQMGLPEDLSAIDTPGHTPGHTSFLLSRESGILFVGDAAANKKGVVSPGFPNAGGGPEIARSIGHLGEFEYEIALFGHAAPITSGASAAFRAFSG